MLLGVIVMDCSIDGSRTCVCVLVCRYILPEKLLGEIVGLHTHTHDDANQRYRLSSRTS
jgi:hypothetical protein